MQGVLSYQIHTIDPKKQTRIVGKSRVSDFDKHVRYFEQLTHQDALPNHI